MKKLIEKLEALLELGDIKKDVTLLALSGAAVICSLCGVRIGAFDPAWAAIILCGVPIVMEAVIGLVTTELNPAEGVKTLNVELIKQKEQFNSDLAEKDTKIAETKAVADWAVLAAVTNTESPLDPTLYARGLELVEAGQAGKTYKPYEIFTVNDPSHTPKYGEGQRVLVQVNQEFTYNNETVADLEGSLSQNGKLAVWKWTEPKANAPQPAGELETQPVQ